MSVKFCGTYHNLKPEDVRFEVVVGKRTGATPWLELGDVHYCIESEDVFKAIVTEAAAGFGYCRARTKE